MRWAAASLLVILLLACAPQREQEQAWSPACDEVAAGTGTPPPPPPLRRRGIWILAEGSVRVLDDPARIPAVLDRAEALGVDDLFVQVYRGGRAFYPAGAGIERSPAADLLAAQGVDALAELIAAAQLRGLAVHAWVNVLSLSTRRDAALIGELGADAILVDRKGRSLLDYPEYDIPEPDRRFYRMGTPGVYLDPALPRVRTKLLATFRDLLTRYPGLRGLHLDYIRHPGVLPFSPGSRFGVGLEFGYGPESRALYRAETGMPDPIEGAPEGTVRAATTWDDWRRDQVTRLVTSIAEMARQTRNDITISAAVIPYVDRAYLSLAQDWRRWLEEGALDLAIPMVYTLDDRLFRYQVEGFAGWPVATRIRPGVGVWLFAKSPGRALGQLARLEALDLSGDVLFSDDALSEAPDLMEALARANRSERP